MEGGRGGEGDSAVLNRNYRSCSQIVSERAVSFRPWACARNRNDERIHSYTQILTHAVGQTGMTHTRAIPIALMARSRVKEINRPCHSKSAASVPPRRASSRRTHIDGRQKIPRRSPAPLHAVSFPTMWPKKRPNRAHTFIIGNTKDPGKGSAAAAPLRSRSSDGRWYDEVNYLFTGDCTGE